MMTNTLLLDNPQPDFAGLVRVLKGEDMPHRVPIIEMSIDPEILQTICERELGETWALPHGDYGPSTPDETYYRQLIQLYYRLGYDYVPVWPIWIDNPAAKHRTSEDTAGASRGQRDWVDQHHGLIASRADFEAFPWDQIHADLRAFDVIARHLPIGLKATVSLTMFEYIFENLLGYEGFFTFVRTDPQLVTDVFQRWGQIAYDFYAATIGLDVVGGIFHADDMGFKTSTLISPADLRRLVFPWLKKYVDLAHAHGKPFWIHSCGNLYRKGVIDELIDDVGIDGFHSFQDVILPVTDFKPRYGARVATLGGVDMDNLARLEGAALRDHVRHILDVCMPGGRFALGSGNTIANYIPLENYAILLNEARHWPER